MVSIETFSKLALSLPGTTEQPHFEKTSFRKNNKIFATLNAATNKACVKLSKTDQDVFCLYDKTAIYPVPNNWGLQGWTMIELSKVRKDMCRGLLTTACEGTMIKAKSKAP